MRIIAMRGQVALQGVPKQLATGNAEPVRELFSSVEEGDGHLHTGGYNISYTRSSARQKNGDPNGI